MTRSAFTILEVAADWHEPMILSSINDKLSDIIEEEQSKYKIYNLIQSGKHAVK